MLHALLALAWAGEPTFTVDPARSAAIVGTAAALEWAIHTRIVPEAEPDGEVAAPVGPDAWVPAHYAPSVGRVSDVLLGATLIGGTALALHDGLRDGQAPMARLWIVGEAVATTLVATDVLKLTFTRPRPYTALEDDPAVAAQRRGFDSEMSFPSGHSSLAAAAAVSTVRMLALSGSMSGGRSPPRLAQIGKVIPSQLHGICAVLAHQVEHVLVPGSGYVAGDRVIGLKDQAASLGRV